MAKDQKIIFRKLLQHRIRLLREDSGFSRDEMASILDVLTDTYRKWELSDGTTMPSYYYVKFCTVVRANLKDFLTPMPIEDEDIAMHAYDTSVRESIMESPEVKRSGNSLNKDHEHIETSEIRA